MNNIDDPDFFDSGWGDDDDFVDDDGPGAISNEWMEQPEPSPPKSSLNLPSIRPAAPARSSRPESGHRQAQKRSREMIPRSATPDAKKEGVAGLVGEMGFDASAFDNPMFGVAAGAAKVFLDKNVDKTLAQYANASFMSVDYYKPYFQVDNTYVIYKLKAILMPCLHKNWQRKTIGAGNGDNGKPLYALPKDDINAPDFYIPAMSMITYVIVQSYMLGLNTDKDAKFTPDVLFNSGTTAFGLMVIEMFVLALGFYLLGARHPPSWMDLLAFSGYKLVVVILSLLAYIASSNGYVYYGTAGLLSLSLLYFGYKTMTTSYLTEETPNASANKNAKYIFLLVLAGFQVVAVLLLGLQKK